MASQKKKKLGTTGSGVWIAHCSSTNSAGGISQKVSLHVRLSAMRYGRIERGREREREREKERENICGYGMPFIGERFCQREGQFVQKIAHPLLHQLPFLDLPVGSHKCSQILTRCII